MSVIRNNDVRWLLLGTLDDPGPYIPVDVYHIDFPDLYCCVFQIKDDPLDNRLGVDLEVLYEDLQLIITHRPHWSGVPSGKFKTYFARGVLERLQEQAAEQQNAQDSKHSAGLGTGREGQRANQHQAAQ